MNRFPDEKTFAFTIFDDTDLSTVENVKPMYQLLEELGMRTTKSVWPLASVPGSRYGGASLQEDDYLKFVLELQEKGFEIALHNVRNTHSTREKVEQGLEEFCRLVGKYPRTHANHSSNCDSIYWGAARFSTFIRQIYNVIESANRHWHFDGHVEDSPYFWGDLCRSKIQYVRNFVFREINLDRINPSMPYHDPCRSYVNAWFSSADGGDARRFCDLLDERNQDRLESEGGVCIVHTHFACGFVADGERNSRAEALLRRLAQKNGWFVPVSTLLDWLHQQRRSLSIPADEITRMERRWFRDRVGRACSTLFDKGGYAPASELRLSPPEPKVSPRIVHMTSAHPPFDVRIFHKECQSLARAGYRVVELANCPSDTASDRVEIRGLGRSRGRLHRMTTKLARLTWEAFRLNADAYHIHDPELLLPATLLRACGKHVVYDAHEDLPRTVLYKRYVPQCLRRPLMWLVERAENQAASCMSGLVAATPAIADRFQSINRNTIVVNNYPLAYELVSSCPWSSREMAVTYIGGVSVERGIHEMLTGIGQLRPSLAARLELAGRFFVDQLESQVRQRPEWRHVIWHGMLNRQQLRDLLSRVRVGLVVLHPVPNFLVSQPVKLFEYMAAGIPVIASDFPLWRSIVSEAECGILVDPCRPEQITEAIEYLLTHDSEAEAMGRRGRVAVEQRYNWKHEEPALLQFYGSLTSSRSSEATVQEKHAEA